MKRKFGINVVSLFPWCLGKNGFNNSWKIAGQAGFDGLQILPLRGWDTNQVRPLKSVISFEDAWNSGSLMDALKRLFGLKEKGATFLDWFLFGNKRETERRFKDFLRYFAGSKTILSSHCAGKYPLEIHPEAGLSEAKYQRYGAGLVWDTRHIRRGKGGGASGPVTVDWGKFLEKVKDSIKLIHIQPINGKEFKELMDGQDNELTEMLSLLNKKTSCPIIMEIKPEKSNIFQIVKRLILIRKSIQKHIF